MNLPPVSAAEATLALVVVGIVFFVVAIYYSNEHEKKLALAWAEVASRFGLDQLGKFDLAGSVEGFAVGAEVYTTGSGKNRTTWTKVTIEGDLTRAVILGREGFFSSLFGQDIVTGDRGFDQAVVVKGDEAAALALLDEPTRDAFRSAVEAGWGFEDGRWTFKVAKRLGAELGDRLEVGLSLANLTRKGQSELPQRLLALVTHDTVSNVRHRALSHLIAHYANSRSTAKALEVALRDREPAIRLLAATRLLDRDVLSALAAAESVAAPLRVEALEALVRQAPDDPRTRERVASWLGRNCPFLLRKAAIEAIVRVAVADAESQLVAALSDSDDELKLAAIRSLGAIGTVNAVPALTPIRDKLLAFTLKGAAKDAILAIQARIAGADAGALSLAGEGGALAMVEEEQA